MTDAPLEKIRIAIVGAGVTALSLAHGLLQNPRLSVQVYEARDKLAEDGTGVGISMNGQKSLALISANLRQCLDLAGAVELDPDVRFFLADENRGTHISDMRFNPPNRTVVRSRFVIEMLKTIPAATVKTSKRLVAIEQPQKSRKVLLQFEDGSEEAVDSVIGCDGINSFVRKHVLGSDSSVEERFGPGFNTRIMVPIAEAREIFGDAYCDVTTQTGWIGENGFCLTDFEDEGQTMQVIAGFRYDEPVAEMAGKPFAQVEKDFWTRRLKGWGWIGECISEVVRRQDRVFAASRKDHKPTPTYVKKRVCIAGDAARAFAPARGAGASQGLEDALALSTLFGALTEASEVEKALSIYDQFRRPRRERVSEESNDAMSIITGRHPDCGRDVEKLRQKVASWNDFIFEYDLENLQKICREAMQGEANH